MDSIARKALVIGPCIGAFKDLDGMNVICTYTSYGDLIIKLKSMLSGRLSINSKKLINFLSDSQWPNFATQFNKFIS